MLRRFAIAAQCLSLLLVAYVLLRDLYPTRSRPGGEELKREVSSLRDGLTDAQEEIAALAHAERELRNAVVSAQRLPAPSRAPQPASPVEAELLASGFRTTELPPMATIAERHAAEAGADPNPALQSRVEHLLYERDLAADAADIELDDECFSTSCKIRISGANPEHNRAVAHKFLREFSGPLVIMPPDNEGTIAIYATLH
jgi:hypothetical protein